MNTKLKNIDSIPLFSAGFRPFFIASVICGISVIILWVLYLSGAIYLNTYFTPLIWHAHEMLFGFAGAVILGFLLTATQNWTGKRGIHGFKLLLLLSIWTLGRILIFTTTQQSIFVSFIDLMLFPLTIFMLIPYLGDKSQRRNVVFLFLLSFLFLGNLLIHIDRFGITSGMDRRGIYLVLDTIILMILLVGGRVIPFFTSSAFPAWKRKPIVWLDIIGLGSIFIFIFADFFYPASTFAHLLALFTAIVNAVRIFRYFDSRVIRNPILAILYIAVAWIIFGLVLNSLNIPRSIGTHAITIGGISVMIYGFITRVSLGHTGRPIHASKLMIFGYSFINLAAIVRILGALIPSINFKLSLHLSATFWVIALILFLIEYIPILFSKRLEN